MVKSELPDALIIYGSGALKKELVACAKQFGVAERVVFAGQTQNIILSEPLCKIGDYADSVDSDGIVTRRIKKLVLTGQEAWEHYGSSVFWTKIEDNDTIVSENA